MVRLGIIFVFLQERNKEALIDKVGWIFSTEAV